MRQVARIAGLFIYPVKGCAGIPLATARLTARGLEHDRRWMIVDPGGRFRTQREMPQLATIRPELVGDTLRLTLGDGAPLLVPLAEEGQPVEVRVWRDQVSARSVAPEVDDALSAWLGRPMRLVRFPEQSVRPCDPAYAPTGSHTGFADGFPLLVTSEASLAVLNDALAEGGSPPVPMGRFRPNIVLADIPAGAEDRHAAIEFEDGLELDLVKRCDRCVVTTIDQASGERTGAEPLATLKRIRRNPDTRGAWFGQNAVPRFGLQQSPQLTVGDACTLREA